ncbi:MAG: hypothetical protein HY608_09645 [Planctomycetes bacterium]|nr:hypothetical protein [Planctomycetota bacterium]
MRRIAFLTAVALAVPSVALPVPPRYRGKYAGTREGAAIERAVDRSPDEVADLYRERLGVDARPVLASMGLFLQDASSLPPGERGEAKPLDLLEGVVRVRSEFFARNEASLPCALAEFIVQEAMVGADVRRWRSLPEWFREGARLYVSGSGEDLLRDVLARKTLAELVDAIDGLQGKHEDEDLPESYLAFVAIADRLGERGMADWISRVRAGESPEDVLAALWGAGWGPVLDALRASAQEALRDRAGEGRPGFEALYAEYKDGDEQARMRLIPRWQALLRSNEEAVWADRGWYYLARCYDAASRHDLAAEAFGRVLRADARPSRADDATFYLAKSWHRARRADEARAAYGRYLRDWFDGSHRKEAYALLVDLEAGARRKPEARRWLEAFAAEYPDARELRGAREQVEEIR